MSRWIATILVASFVAVSVSPAVSAQISQPDIIQEHWYHSYATLTLDLNAWADEHPDIVNLLVVGQTELGRNLWMLQISDWSMDSKPDGTYRKVLNSRKIKNLGWTPKISFKEGLKKVIDDRIN